MSRSDAEVPSLRCCEAARATRAVILVSDGQGGEDFARLCREVPPRWHLNLGGCRPRDGVGDASVYRWLATFATPVRCCPFCGAAAPALRLKADPPSRPRVSVDGGYSCSTCGGDRDCRCAPAECLWEPVPTSDRRT